jgi:hypothetical protein
MSTATPSTDYLVTSCNADHMPVLRGATRGKSNPIKGFKMRLFGFREIHIGLCPRLSRLTTTKKDISMLMYSMYSDVHATCC